MKSREIEKFDLLCHLYHTVVFFCFRLVALPIGRYFKIKESKPKRAESNPYLEDAFKKHRKLLPKDKVQVIISIALHNDILCFGFHCDSVLF